MQVSFTATRKDLESETQRLLTLLDEVEHLSFDAAKFDQVCTVFEVFDSQKLTVGIFVYIDRAVEVICLQNMKSKNASAAQKHCTFTFVLFIAGECGHDYGGKHGR